MSIQHYDETDGTAEVAQSSDVEEAAMQLGEALHIADKRAERLHEMTAGYRIIKLDPPSPGQEPAPGTPPRSKMAAMLQEATARVMILSNRLERMAEEMQHFNGR